MIQVLQQIVSGVILTIAIESLVLVFFGKFKPDNFFLVFVLINVLTNLLVNAVSLWVYPQVSIYMYVAVMLVMEIVVFIVEGYVFTLVDQNKKRMYLLSLIANGCSLVLGGLLIYFVF